MSRKPIALLLALLGSAFLTPLPLSAAEETAAKPSAKAQSRPAARRAPVGVGDQFGQQVFQTLIGEFALRQGEPELAAEAWTDLAVRTRDPAILARATQVLAMTRHYERALQLVELWQQIEPESARAKQMRSTLLVLANRIDDLSPQIAQMLAQDRDNLRANLLQLNRLLARHGDKKAVQRLVERLVAPYRDLPEAHFAMAQAALAAGDDAKALEEAERACELNPDWEPGAILRAQLQMRRISGVHAIEQLDTFVRAHPKAADARLLLARMLIGERRPVEARAHLEQLDREIPGNPDILYPLAMLSLQQGETAKGRGLLEKLLETDFPDRSTVHFFLGQIAEEGGQAETALSEYQQVTNGDQYFAARGRSVILLQKAGKIEAARALLRETRGNTAQERAQLALAESQLLREAGRNKEAYAVITAALQAEPDNLDLLYEAGMLAEREDDLADMEKHLRRLLTVKPDHAHGLNALGYAYADRNIRLDEAEALIRRALEVTPDDPFITDSLGWVLFRQNKLDEALATLQRAYKGKADPEIAAHIGEVLWAMGRRDEARRLLLDAQKQNPGHEALSSTIKKLLP